MPESKTNKISKSKKNAKTNPTKSVISNKTKKLMNTVQKQRIDFDNVKYSYLDKKYISNSDNITVIPGLTYRTFDSIDDDKIIYYCIIPIVTVNRDTLAYKFNNTKTCKLDKKEMEILEVTFLSRSDLDLYNEQVPDSKIQEYNLEKIQTSAIAHNVLKSYLDTIASEFNKKDDLTNGIKLWRFLRNGNISSTKYNNWDNGMRFDINKNTKSNALVFKQTINKKYWEYYTTKLLPAYISELDISHIVSPKTKLNVAIIGAGPVALCIAYVLAKSNKYNITIYEKRKEYTRNQYLVINLLSIRFGIFNKIGDILHKKGNICYIHPPPNDVLGHCYKEVVRGSRHIHIRISEFERMMRKECLDTGSVTFIMRDIQQPSDITEPYHILFGCEGGRSFTRDKLLKATKVDDVRYKSYGIIMNYIDNTTYRYRQKTRKITINAPQQNRYRFFRGRDRYAYLGIQLTEKEYSKQVQNATSFGQLPKTLQKTFHDYWHLYKSKPAPIPPLKGTIKDIPVQSFEIKHVHYDKYADIVDGKLCLIVGDSVSQSHFFTASGLINGLINGQNIISYMISNIDIVKYNEAKLKRQFKFMANQYNVETTAIINEYWESTRYGYNMAKLVHPICKRLTHADWKDIKNQIQSQSDADFFGKQKIIDLDWFDDDNEMCKMYANLVIAQYPHLA